MASAFHCFRYALFMLCLLGCSIRLAAQTHSVDSLRKALAHSAAPSQRLSLAFQLCEAREALSADSLLHYAQTARRLSEQLKAPDQQSLAMFYIIVAIQSKGLLDSALALTEHQLSSIVPEQYDLLQKFTYQKATLLIRRTQYKEGIAEGYKVLQLAEEHHDTMMQMASRNCIGWACMEMKNYQEAIGWFRHSIATASSLEYDKVYGIASSNLAAVYNSLQQFDSGEYWVTEAIQSNRRTESLSKLANALAIQADLFMLTGRQQKAEAPLQEALRIRQHIGDPYYIVSDLYQLALYYAQIGQPLKGIELSMEGIALARKYKLNAKLPILYEAQAACYKAAGDWKNHSAILEKLMAIKDSIYQSNSSEAVSALQAKYQVAKSDNIIMKQKLALIRQNGLLFGALGLVLLIVTGSVILFQRSRRRQRREMARMVEEEKRAAAAAIHHAEEAERKRIAADLHDNLGAYAAAIAFNIDHLAPGTGGAVASASVMHELRANSRDMVSQLADTIWVLKKDALPLTAISDRLKIFLQRIGASHPEIELEVVEEIKDDVVLYPTQAFHLFRMVQEAVNNAVRHSGGTQVIVFLESDGKRSSIRIADNGRGMNGAVPGLHSDGNGLHNMRARAEAGGWRIAWLPGRPSGTTVLIEPTTN